MIQALLSWLSIIARQPFLSLVIDFEADFLSQTVTGPFRNIQRRLGKQNGNLKKMRTFQAFFSNIS
jgi:hypothetical protein